MTESLRKIAFFDSYHEAFYGSHQSLFTLVTRLNRVKYEPIFVTTNDGIVADRFREAGVETVVLKAGGIGNVFGKAVLEYSLLQKLRAGVDLLMHGIRVFVWLRRQDVSLVYVNDLRSMVFAGFSARCARLPLLWYVRDDFRHNRLQALALRLATRVFVIADGVKRAFTPVEREAYGDKIVTLYTGFDFPRYEFSHDQVEAMRSTLGISSTDKVVGIVGSITPRKGYEVLARAAPEILGRFPGTVILAVGGSVRGHESYERSVKDMVSDAGMEKHFVWTGYRKDIESVVAVMDVVVLPSTSEGLPRTLIEALACGKPAVATDVGGVQEILTTDLYGQVIEVGDAGALAEAVCQLLNQDPGDPEKAKLRREYVKKKFDLGTYVCSFEDEMERLME